MPSQSLQGLTTTSGWTVTQQLGVPPGTGGNFCVRYVAKSADGQIGFLKAMDLTKSLGDITRLQQTVNEYVFEQDILNQCKERKMTKVVTPLDAGTINVPGFAPPVDVVYYVIFEKADGSLRDSHLQPGHKNWSAAFVALHHVAIGLEQLHRAEVAHQDIKPSNILNFDEKLFKVSDLGRVVDKAGSSPFSGVSFPGDRTYRPTEIFFGINSFDFNFRRSCDMYMLGSLAFHLVEDVPINICVIKEAQLIKHNLNHLTFSDALPYLVSGFNTVLRRYRESCEKVFGTNMSELLCNVVSEMCNPDPSKRGAPKVMDESNRMSVRRYVGKFAHIVRQSKIEGI